MEVGVPGWKTLGVIAFWLPSHLSAQSWPPDSGKSYVIPAMEIVVFDALLNAFDRAVLGEGYRTSMESIRHNLRTRWVTENDPFEINQFGHPLQGSMYHGFARSSGLNFWTSFAYTFAGSAMWEIAGETTPPSWNDQIASGIAGAFLGEALFRVGSLILETAPLPLRPGRKLVTAVTSFPLAVNRRVFDRFDAVYPSDNAAYNRRLSFGASSATKTRGAAGLAIQSNEAVLDFSMEYGLPGAKGYQYKRPFDYFSMQANFTSGTGLESILLRGLLIGDGYELGGDYRGAWGLYGNYDYIAPEVFRISTTALALGTTAEWQPSSTLAVQATAMGGVGFAAVGALARVDTSDYHYGMTPQALLASRIIFSDRAALDFTGREYYVEGVGNPGHDNIVRLDAAFTMRLHQQNAIGVRYLLSRRDAHFPGGTDRTQLRGTLGVFYTLLGHDRFGSVR